MSRLAVLVPAAAIILTLHPAAVNRGLPEARAAPRTAGTDLVAVEDVYTLRLAVSDLQRRVGALERELESLRHRYAGHRHVVEGTGVAVSELFAHRNRYLGDTLLLSPKGRAQTTTPPR